MNINTSLIVHPLDPSTDFLIPIYEGIPHKKVIRSGFSKSELRNLIDKHDRVLMMGHGSENGLFSIGNFTDKELYIIDHSFVNQLSIKKNNVFIWCHASTFVKKLKLSGFYTGMFISELSEAYYCSLKDVNQKMVNESNNSFSDIVSKYIEFDNKTIHSQVKQEYAKIAASNKIAAYNLDRIYFN